MFNVKNSPCFISSFSSSVIKPSHLRSIHVKYYLPCQLRMSLTSMATISVKCYYNWNFHGEHDQAERDKQLT